MIKTQILWADPVWIAETTDGQTWVEVARGTAGSEAEGRAAAEASLGLGPDADELESAQTWGARLVRDFEAGALKGGVNDDPTAALALDRYLREVSGAVAAGRLHVAYAALSELLTTPERERPAPPFTDDAQLVPVYNAIAARIGRDPWSKR